MWVSFGTCKSDHSFNSWFSFFLPHHYLYHFFQIVSFPPSPMASVFYGTLNSEVLSVHGTYSVIVVPSTISDLWFLLTSS